MNYVIAFFVASLVICGIYTAVKSRNEPTLFLLTLFFWLVAAAFFFRLQHNG